MRGHGSDAEPVENRADILARVYSPPASTRFLGADGVVGGRSVAVTHDFYVGCG